MTSPIELDALQIAGMLPHRYPFLLIDRVTDCVPQESITALKNVTFNEPFFQGHFPDNPVMPGVLVVEALAQACCALSHLSEPELDPRPLYMLAGVDRAKFRRPVRPGDQLVLNISVDKVRRGMWWYLCKASVDGELAVSATITCAPAGA